MGHLGQGVADGTRQFLASAQRKTCKTSAKEDASVLRIKDSRPVFVVCACRAAGTTTGVASTHTPKEWRLRFGSQTPRTDWRMHIPGRVACSCLSMSVPALCFALLLAPPTPNTAPRRPSSWANTRKPLGLRARAVPNSPLTGPCLGRQAGGTSAESVQTTGLPRSCDGSLGEAGLWIVVRTSQLKAYCDEF